MPGPDGDGCPREPTVGRRVGVQNRSIGKEGAKASASYRRVTKAIV
jgi:hypothetical protein